MSIRNLIAICETVEGHLLNNLHILKDVFISCAFNGSAKIMPETLKYSEELLEFWKEGKGTMYGCPRVYARYGKRNEINKKWQMTRFWVLPGEFINC